MQHFVTMHVARTMHACTPVWLRSEGAVDGLVVGTRPSGAAAPVACGPTHVVRQLLALQPTFWCIVHTFDGGRVASFTLLVDAAQVRAQMRAAGELRCAPQLRAMLAAFRGACTFGEGRAGLDAGGRAALRWARAVDEGGVAAVPTAVAVGGTGWSLAVPTGDVQPSAHDRAAPLAPRAFVLNTPTPASRVGRLADALWPAPGGEGASPGLALCAATWSVVASGTSLVLCAEEERRAWVAGLGGRRLRVLTFGSCAEVAALRLRDLAAADVVVLPHAFFDEAYARWATTALGGGGGGDAPSLAHASQLAVRRAHAARRAAGELVAVPHLLRWRRVLVEDFDRLPTRSAARTLRARVVFGLSDRAELLPPDVLHAFALGDAPVDRHALAACVRLAWGNGATAGCARAVRRVPRDEAEASSPPPANALPLRYIPRAHRRRRLCRALRGCPPAYAAQQAARFAAGTCPVCFGAADCLTRCGHFLCAACARRLRPSSGTGAAQCPTCRQPVADVLTHRYRAPARLRALERLCLGTREDVLVLSDWEPLSSSLRGALAAKGAAARVRVVPFDCAHAIGRRRYGQIVVAHLPQLAAEATRATLRRACALCDRCTIVYSQDTEEEAGFAALVAVRGDRWALASEGV